MFQLKVKRKNGYTTVAVVILPSEVDKAYIYGYQTSFTKTPAYGFYFDKYVRIIILGISVGLRYMGINYVRFID